MQILLFKSPEPRFIICIDHSKSVVLNVNLGFVAVKKQFQLLFSVGIFRKPERLQRGLNEVISILFILVY